jgi:tryptophan-rich sensory protein
MAIADLAAVLFTATNVLRAMAYVPQLRCVWKDRRRADAVSIASWALFAASNGATVAYAVFTLRDRTMAIIFAINALFCLAIVVITVWKRMRGIGRI